ncbi:MAG: extracellular solute-binding protein [Roseburia sp.]|nr:extracellular solute-binding protein [Roseburia sp.]
MKRKLTALIMGMVLMISGCAGTQDGLSADGTAAQVSGETGGGPVDSGENKENESVAMGRYVETATDLSDQIGSPRGLGQLENGDIVAVGESLTKAVSHDNGETWEQEPIAGLEESFFDDNYIMEMSVAPNGTIIIQYTPHGSLDDEEMFFTDMRYLAIRPDGTQRSITVEPEGEELYGNRYFFDGEGKCYMTMLGSGNIYELNLEDGSKNRFLKIEGSRADNIQFVGNKAILCYYDGIRIYDMETQEYTEDAVLEDFIKEQYGQLEDYGNYFGQYLFTDNQEAVYIAGEKGLHRHVMGGTSVEQVIDGALSSFSDPSRGILRVIVLENQEFVALFSDGKAVRYVYDPNTPTVPNDKLVIYSLQPNDTVQQAITMYQSANPTLYLEYQIGMGENNTVTREDALKKLNTELMAGEGPDILILDGMPLDSYMEKKILSDIRGTVDAVAQTDGLFTNLLEPFYQGEALYAAPCEIKLPYVSGEKEKVTRMSDLESAADAIEQIAQENPDKQILEVYSPKGVMKKFGIVSAPAWKQADGTVDMAKIEEFLTQTKRIYDAQMQNATQERRDWYTNLNDVRYPNDAGVTLEDTEWFLSFGSGTLNHVSGALTVGLGTLYYQYGCADVFSLPKTEGFEDTAIAPLRGQCSEVFLPKTLVGINASGANQEASKEFLSFMLGSEVQTMLHNGLPINQAAYELEFTPPDWVGEDKEYGGVASVDADGMTVSVDFYWLEDEELEAIRSQMTSARIPYLYDAVLEEAVYAIGKEYFQGRLSLEAAMKQIEQKVAIYAAE